MANIIYDEDPNTPLNKKIATLWAFSVEMTGGCKEEFIKMCREIYEMGIESGQEFVWAMRAGKFVETDLDEDKNTITITTNSSLMNNDQLDVQHVKFNKGVVMHIKGLEDEHWDDKDESKKE